MADDISRAASVCALAVVACSVLDLTPAGADILEQDLRYVGRATAWAGCFESRSVEFVNPLNLENNILAFVGTPRNPHPEIEFEVDLPEGVEAGTTVRASFQSQVVVQRGWEPVKIVASVQYQGRGAPLSRSEYKPSGNVDCWSFTFSSKGPGRYRTTVRVGDARYFAGWFARTCVLAPEPSGPVTRAEWFARRLINEAVAVACDADQVYGSEVRLEVDQRFPQVGSGGPENVVRWRYDGFESRTYGVAFGFEVAPEDVSTDLLVGVICRYPVGDGQLQVRDFSGAVIESTPIYPSPEVRVIWMPVRLAQPGTYHVVLKDTGVGRAEADVYRMCYVKAAEKGSPD